MLNRVIAFIAGLLSSFITIMMLEALAHFLFPMPQVSELPDVASPNQNLFHLPFGAILLVLLAYYVGSFTGGAVIKMIIKQNRVFDAIRLGAVLMFLGLFNLLTFPHPWWFWVLSLVGYIPMSWLGYKIVTSKRKRRHDHQFA